MYQKQIAEINADLKRTRKAIISLGCSFVQGQGAVDDDMYTNYEWKFEKVGIPLQLDPPAKEKQAIVEKYAGLISLTSENKLDFTFMEYKNAFVNVLCKKYFDGEYTPINLGLRGNGNRGTIKELYFHPNLNWKDIDECIVIYCPSGMERFDFVNDAWLDHHHWNCMWPHYKDQAGAKRTLWEGYAKALWSEKFEVLENIGHVQELMTWCNAHDARLIITPGFDHRYTPEYIRKSVFDTVVRNTKNEVMPSWGRRTDQDNYLESIVNLWPWDLMYCPGGYATFVDLITSKEHLPGYEKFNYFDYIGKGSPNGWITACSHPSAKGHDLFAKYLYHYIVTGDENWKE
jgi:hypothetical protein